MEPEALAAFGLTEHDVEDTGTPDSRLAECAQLSAAISLKRIADLLQEQKK